MGYVKKTPGGTSEFKGGLTFEGVTEDNFDTNLIFDDPTAIRNIEFPDADGHVVLSKDAARLVGAVPAYGSAVESNVQYDYTQQAIKLYNSIDTSIGVAFPAFQVNQIPGQKFKISIAVKGDVASADGLYIRLQELDSPLNGNKTHVCNGAGSSSPFVQEETRQITGWIENAAVPTVWTTYTYTYTPTSTAQWTSVIVLNWTGHGTNSLWMQPPQVTPLDGGDPVFNDPEISGLTLTDNTNIVSTTGGDLWLVGLNSISNVDGAANLIVGNNSYDWDNNARPTLELRQWGYSNIVGGPSGIAFADVTQSRIDFTAKHQNTASGADSTSANVVMARIENLIDHSNLDKIQSGKLKLQAYDTTNTNGGTLPNSSIIIGNEAIEFNTTTSVTFDLDGDIINLPNASGTVAVSVSDTTTTTQGDLNLDFTLSAAGNVSATGDAHGLATTDSPTFAGVTAESLSIGPNGVLGLAEINWRGDSNKKAITMNGYMTGMDFNAGVLGTNAEDTALYFDAIYGFRTGRLFGSTDAAAALVYQYDGSSGSMTVNVPTTFSGSIDNNTVYIYEAGSEPGNTGGTDPAGLYNMVMMAEAQTTGNAKRALMVDNGGVMFDPSTNVFRVGGPVVATNVQTGPGGFVSFEGVTDDANETLLAAQDPSQDNIINLPNDSGDVALTSVPTGSTTSSTVLDGEPLVWSQTRPEGYSYDAVGRSLKRGVANVAEGTIRQLRSCYDDTRDLIYLVWVESSGGDTLYINALKPRSTWFPNSSLTWGATTYTQTIGSGFKILGCTYNSDLDLLVVCTMGSSGGSRFLRYYKLKEYIGAGSLGDIVACGQTGGFGSVAGNAVGDIVYDKYSKKVYMYAVDNNGAVDTEYWCNARLNFGTDESPTSVSSTTPTTNTRNSTVVPVYAKIAINDLKSDGLRTVIAAVYQSDAYCVSGYTNDRVYPLGASDTQITTGITVFRTGADTRGDQVGITFDPSSNKFVVIYVDENNSATGAIEEVLARPFSYDGGNFATITMGTELELNPGAQFFCDISADRSTGKLLALYRDYDGGSNSAFYHTLVCNDNNTLTSEGFTDLNTTGLIDTVNTIYSPVTRSVWGFVVPTDSDIDAYEFRTAMTRATDQHNKHLGISKTTDGSRIYKPGEVLTVPASLLPTDLTPGKEVWVNAFGDYICSNTTYKKVGLALSANTVLLY